MRETERGIPAGCAYSCNKIYGPGPHGVAAHPPLKLSSWQVIWLNPSVLMQLVVAFLRIGIFGFGGGPSFIPLVEIEAVDNYHWMTSEEFSEVLAMGYTMPGPIATKMAWYIGYKVAGMVGGFTAVTALLLPSTLMMLGLFYFFTAFRHLPWVEGMGRAIRPVVAVLLAILVWEIGLKSVNTLGVWLSTALIVASAVMLQVLHIHPAVVVSAALLFGALFVR